MGCAGPVSPEYQLEADQLQHENGTDFMDNLRGRENVPSYQNIKFLSRILEGSLGLLEARACGDSYDSQK